MATSLWILPHFHERYLTGTLQDAYHNLTKERRKKKNNEQIVIDTYEIITLKPEENVIWYFLYVGQISESSKKLKLILKDRQIRGRYLSKYWESHVTDAVENNYLLNYKLSFLI